MKNSYQDMTKLAPMSCEDFPSWVLNRVDEIIVFPRTEQRETSKDIGEMC